MAGHFRVWPADGGLPRLYAYDWDNTLVMTGVMVSPGEYLDEAAMLGLPTTPVFDEMVQRLKDGHDVAIVTGRASSMVQALWRFLDARRAWGAVTIYTLPAFPGERELGYWKAGVLQAIGADEYVGDHALDAVAARLSGTPFRLVASPIVA